MAMSKAEAGRLGGKATVARHGAAHMSTIGKRGFSALARRFGKCRWRALLHLNGAGRVKARFIPRHGVAPPEWDAMAAEMYREFGLEDDGPAGPEEPGEPRPARGAEAEGLPY